METKMIVNYHYEYGFFEMSRETDKTYFIKKYKLINKPYDDFCLLISCDSHSFSVFTGRLEKEEIKVSKKKFKELEIKKIKIEIGQAIIYSCKLAENDEKFYYDDLVRKVCCFFKIIYCHMIHMEGCTIEYNLKIWDKFNKENIECVLKPKYKLLNDSQKDYVNKWINERLSKHSPLKQEIADKLFDLIIEKEDDIISTESSYKYDSICSSDTDTEPETEKKPKIFKLECDSDDEIEKLEKKLKDLKEKKKLKEEKAKKIAELKRQIAELEDD
jgi:hypothetical protein